MTDAKRIEEAEQCIKRAQEHVKTSVLKMKFKPDYDSAASEMDRAAVCFKNAKVLDKCLEAYERAGEYHEKNGVLFHAAKCKEQAALICRDLNQIEKAKELMDQASNMYFESGTPQTSAMALEKAAKFFETTDPDKAVDVYRKAYELVCETDKIRQASEFLSKISKLLVKLEKFKEAATNIRQEIEMYSEGGDYSGMVGKLTTNLVLVHLKLADPGAAESDFQKSFRVKGFDRTEESRICNALINAFEGGDVKQFQTLLDRPDMRSLDIDYVRLMQTIEIPEEFKARGRANVGSQESDMAKTSELVDAFDEDDLT